jgi:hypothetical protein
MPNIFLVKEENKVVVNMSTGSGLEGGKALPLFDVNHTSLLLNAIYYAEAQSLDNVLLESIKELRIARDQCGESFVRDRLTKQIENITRVHDRILMKQLDLKK